MIDSSLGFLRFLIALVAFLNVVALTIYQNGGRSTVAWWYIAMTITVALGVLAALIGWRVADMRVRKKH
ncbi:MAG TPA: hypothetical protein VJK03_00660 [Candidatus Nanoarchaeia archaeon]|nr:hypothetical protein [Candidatus Nanoarchaeia archaeon]